MTFVCIHPPTLSISVSLLISTRPEARQGEFDSQARVTWMERSG